MDVSNYSSTEIAESKTNSWFFYWKKYGIRFFLFLTLIGVKPYDFDVDKVNESY
jgi:hypothetical protein